VLHGVLAGSASGAASAVFLTSLNGVTAFRTSHPSWVFALPLAGGVLGWVLETWGRSIRGGNNLVLEAVQDDTPRLPFRAVPFVFGGTLLTHLFGGSAGREGAAVQMGAGLSDLLARTLKTSSLERRDLLVAGISGGFGSVFGTPWAGALFGLEVVTIGRWEYRSAVPAVVAAFVGDSVTRGLGVAHTLYPQVSPLSWSFSLALKWLLFAALTALVARVFIFLTHGLKQVLEARVGRLRWRLFLGGASVVLLWQVLGTDEALGLSLPLLERAFTDPALPTSAFAWKLVFTALTLGAGFLGGEVTPLFVMGACLGNLFARGLGLPLDLCAAVGMAAMFGAAANTPLSLAVMAAELVGAPVLSHCVWVCFAAFWFTGHQGIYSSQRLVRSKRTWRSLREKVRLKDLR